MPESGRPRRWVGMALLATLVVILVASWALAPRHAGQESFGGTDAQVTEALTQRGARPWFSPVFRPDSAELESGLFALQAALGAGACGYALGNLRGRHVERSRARAMASTSSTQSDHVEDPGARDRD